MLTIRSVGSTPVLSFTPLTPPGPIPALRYALRYAAPPGVTVTLVGVAFCACTVARGYAPVERPPLSRGRMERWFQLRCVKRAATVNASSVRAH